MNEFPVAGHNYRASKMDALRQFHVVRRLAPLLAGFGNLSELRTMGLDELLSNIGPGLDALAEMPDKDADYVIHGCLSVVQREHEGGWAPVFARGVLMFQDIELPEMLQLVGKVLEADLKGFFPGKGSTSAPPEQAA